MTDIVNAHEGATGSLRVWLATRDGSGYSPRTRLMMSVAMFGGTSAYTANCIV